MSIFGTFLHLGMDFLNSYGVHPFWPVENGWFYGDSMFIVEPLYWAAAAPLLFVTRSIVMRVLLGTGVAGCAGSECHFQSRPDGSLQLGSWWSRLFYCSSGGESRPGPPRSPAPWPCSASPRLLSQADSWRPAASLPSPRPSFRNDRIIDPVLSPAPLNTLCWNLLLLETNGDHYVVRRAVRWRVHPCCLSAIRCAIDRQPGSDGTADRPSQRRTPLRSVGLASSGLSRTVLARVVAGEL